MSQMDPPRRLWPFKEQLPSKLLPFWVQMRAGLEAPYVGFPNLENGLFGGSGGAASFKMELSDKLRQTLDVSQADYDYRVLELISRADCHSCCWLPSTTCICADGKRSDSGDERCQRCSEFAPLYLRGEATQTSPTLHRVASVLRPTTYQTRVVRLIHHFMMCINLHCRREIIAAAKQGKRTSLDLVGLLGEDALLDYTIDCLGTLRRCQ